MDERINTYFNRLSDPLLFYIDKKGNSIFRNFCLFANNGNKYNKVIQIKNAGKALEYRLSLDKKLKIYTIFLSLIIYLLFIHTICNFKGLILYEFLWIILYFAGRLLCSELYSKKLIKLYGNYEVVNFTPKLKKTNEERYQKDFILKIIIFIICIILFILPAFIMRGIIKLNINKKLPNYKNAEAISNIYNLIYPKSTYILEVQALSEYAAGNFDKASEKYTDAIKLEGKHFYPKDYIRFGNLLYLIKKSDGSQTAIDTFNELATNKNLTLEEQVKLLWIKSVFAVSNNASESVEKDYDDLLISLDKNDIKNKFYINADKAYMLYLKGNYRGAISIYNNILIEYANKNDAFAKELPRLYVERGFAKRKLNLNIDADEDFIKSKINMYDLKKYEPKPIEQNFTFEKF